MGHTYAVFGAGRQGTAAGYDLGRWGDADRIIMADRELEIARQSAERINRLIGRPVAQAIYADVTRMDSVKGILQDVDAFLSAAPYTYNLALTKAAIETRASMADLGGNTDIARQQHTFDAEARAANISIIPDCGQVPGLGTSLCVYTMNLFDKAVDVFMWDGGLPQNPHPPFNYLLTFHIAGLTNEYAEPATFLRNGEITQVEPMTELETVEFPTPIGRLEAFVAGGGTSSMPWTFQGKIRTLQNLTLRHPGHYAQLRAFWDLGLWSLEPIQVGQQTVVPRDVFHALFEPKVVHPLEKDLVIVRIKAYGYKDDQPAVAQVELIDYYDEQTGFTAMERATGWSAAIVVAMAARGLTPRGAGGVETFVPPDIFMNELRQRGFNVTEELRWIDSSSHHP
jgi:lysine 6-dehydrogenase